MYIVTGRNYEERKRKGLCVAYGCKEKRGTKKKLCPKHHSRYQKEKHYLEYTYNLRKQRAKERGKEWDISLEEFRELCDKTNYLNLKGKKKGKASLDRIREEEGYSLSNLQILEIGSNSRKNLDTRFPDTREQGIYYSFDANGNPVESVGDLLF